MPLMIGTEKNETYEYIPVLQSFRNNFLTSKLSLEIVNYKSNTGTLTYIANFHPNSLKLLFLIVFVFLFCFVFVCALNFS